MSSIKRFRQWVLIAKRWLAPLKSTSKLKSTSGGDLFDRKSGSFVSNATSNQNRYSIYAHLKIESRRIASRRTFI
jgi:hypothetical protein